jgi:hypothetical protein
MARKRKHHGKRHHDNHMGSGYDHKYKGEGAEMGMHKPRRMERPNNRGRGPVSEDWSKPCGLPYGPISRDIGNGAYFSMNAYRVGDLYEQVDKNMREDSAGIKSLTKPTNW